jgi:type I restriction enzyme, S subunit
MSRQVMRVGDLADQIRGVSYTRDDASESALPGYLPILRAGNITDDGLTFDDLVYVPSERVSEKQRLRRNDVVIAASSGSLDVVGKAAVAMKDFDGSFGAFCKVLRPNRKVDPTYFAHYFKTAHYRRLVSQLASGANINNLRNEHLDEMLIPLPDFSEQRRIAALLDEADKLRARRKQSIAKLDTLAQSIFLDMFGDPTAKGWKMETIEDVAQEQVGAIRTGPFGSQLLHSEFTDSGVAVLGIDNAVHNEFRWGERRFISEEKYRELLRYTVKPGDVLITIMGTCGRCAIVPDDIPAAVNTKHLCCITLDRKKCLPSFLHAYFLRHPLARRYLAQKAKGAIMEGLNMGIIKGMPVPRAPIALQKKFDQILKGLNSVLADQRCSETYLEALTASLKHRAFRGEL